MVAPLWVPAATAVYSIDAFPHPAQRHWIYITIVVAAIFTYGGVLTLGIPAFHVLRAREHTAFWIAPVVGFCVGVVTGLVFFVLFGLSLRSSFTFIWGELTTNLVVNASGGLITGALGALVGGTLWLIARPDRRRLTSEGSC
jgi:hypothetical protein